VCDFYFLFHAVILPLHRLPFFKPVGDNLTSPPIEDGQVRLSPTLWWVDRGKKYLSLSKN